MPCQTKRRAPLAAFGSVASPQGGRAAKQRKLKQEISIPIAPKSPHIEKLEKGAAALRPGTPKGGLLPCRVAERKRIATHLNTGVEQGGSTQVLYVSGMPGTGKTAIVLEVLEQMKTEQKFVLVHVNAMRLSSPVQIFREIADQLLPHDTNNNDALKDVTDLFNERKAEDPVVVLLIDEVDCLVTPTQAVLYKIFDWLGMPNAKLVLAAISNTMDLPERLLPRVASRFHIERVDFAPYNKSQLYEILCTKLKSQRALDSFNDVVLRLCAARVAGASGDIRKALQVCRRAAEIRLQTESESSDPQGSKVSIADLEGAEKELILANTVAQAVMGLSLTVRRFLSAVVIELRRKDTDVVPVCKAASRFLKLLAATAVDSERSSSTPATTGEDFELAAEFSESGSVVKRLVAMGIVSMQTHVPSSEFSSGEALLSLGSLDIEDLSNLLLKMEDDLVICELLEGGRPDAATARVATQCKLVD